MNVGLFLQTGSIKQLQTRLVIFAHAIQCKELQCTTIQNCRVFRDLWFHTINCQSPQCGLRSCNSSKTMYLHCKQCYVTSCEFCAPIKASINLLLEYPTSSDSNSNTNRTLPSIFEAPNYQTNYNAQNVVDLTSATTDATYQTNIQNHINNSTNMITNNNERENTMKEYQCDTDLIKIVIKCKNDFQPQNLQMWNSIANVLNKKYSKYTTFDGCACYERFKYLTQECQEYHKLLKAIHYFHRCYQISRRDRLSSDQIDATHPYWVNFFQKNEECRKWISKPKFPCYKLMCYALTELNNANQPAAKAVSNSNTNESNSSKDDLHQITDASSNITNTSSTSNDLVDDNTNVEQYMKIKTDAQEKLPCKVTAPMHKLFNNCVVDFLECNPSHTLLQAFILDHIRSLPDTAAIYYSSGKETSNEEGRKRRKLIHNVFESSKFICEEYLLVDDLDKADFLLTQLDATV